MLDTAVRKTLTPGAGGALGTLAGGLGSALAPLGVPQQLLYALLGSARDAVTGTEGDPVTADSIAGGLGLPDSPLSGMAVGVLTDPLTFAGGGLGALGGRVGRGAVRAADAAAEGVSRAAAPLAARANAAEEFARMASTALGHEAEIAGGRHAQGLSRLEAALNGIEPVVETGLEEAGRVPVPGGMGILKRLRQGPMELPPPEAMYNPALAEAAAATQGRKFKPRQYTPGAGQGGLGDSLEGTGLGRAVGGRVELPVPAGELPPSVLAARGGRVFGGEDLANPLATSDFMPGLAPNPKYDEAWAALQTARDAGPQVGQMSVREALGLNPREAAAWAAMTPGLRRAGATGLPGHALDLPLAEGSRAAGAAADATRAELAAALGARPELPPLARALYRLLGHPQAPKLGPVSIESPTYNPLLG